MEKSIFRTLENLMVAVTFAEKGEHETALRMMDSKSRTNPVKVQRKDLNKSLDNRPRMQL